ncbi:MAG: hypothetical protein N2Z84_01695, partial [Atribacterota bacterium]|nr:hypothetical protein [Atribacterota bacterium]
MIKIEEIPFGGWARNVLISNGQIEVVVTKEVGPRIIRCAFVGKPNLFLEMPGEVGLTGGTEWHIFGGHRLWHAPEANPRSYNPDNDPVQFTQTSKGGIFTQSVEQLTGIEKEIEVEMDENENHVRVIHRLKNHNLWSVELAPWALSAMTPNGMAIIPQEPYQSWSENLLPVRPMVLWGNTRMDDPRWRFGNKYVTLKQDPKNTNPNKAGFGNKQGWGAYLFEDYLFLKIAPYKAGACYPDMGCSFEVYTDHRFLELESLGPLIN